MLILQEVLGSSKNPKNLSLTVKGLFAYIVPVVIHVIRITTGVDVEAGLIQSLIDNILLFVQQATTLIATGMVIFGGLRKIYYQIKRKKEK